MSFACGWNQTVLVSPKGHSDSGFVYSLLLSHCVCTDSRMRAVFNTSISSHCGKYTRMVTRTSLVLETTVQHESSDVSLKYSVDYFVVFIILQNGCIRRHKATHRQERKQGTCGTQAHIKSSSLWLFGCI